MVDEMFLAVAVRADLQIQWFGMMELLETHFENHPDAGHRPSDPDHIKSGRVAYDAWMKVPEAGRLSMKDGKFADWLAKQR